MIDKIVVPLCRLYPLKSGCGRLANSRLIKWIERGETKDEWARVSGGYALVPTNDYVGRTLKYFGDLDPKISAIVDKCVEPGGVCLDIGANLGVVSLRMAHRAGPSGQVHSFEPQPRMQSYIERSVERNGFTNIRLHKIALGEVDGVLPLSVPKKNAGRATLKKVHAGTAESIDVPVRRLSDVMDQCDVKQVSLIKMDVEGFEPLVLKGGLDFLRTSKPNAIVLEEHGRIQDGVLPESLSLLSDLNYKIYALPKTWFSVRLDETLGAYRSFDYLALSAEAPEHIRKRLGV